MSESSNANESANRPDWPETDVIRICQIAMVDLKSLLARFRLKVVTSQDNIEIPGSFWGDEEAGLIGDKLYIRNDTPLHSALHEACHYICMSPERRSALDTNAGGDYAEENAVCYLQILLADYLPGLNQKRMMADMDRWGYSFRLGSTQAWFEQDAEDAQEWLIKHHIIDEHNQPLWHCRHSE